VGACGHLVGRVPWWVLLVGALVGALVVSGGFLVGALVGAVGCVIGRVGGCRGRGCMDVRAWLWVRGCGWVPWWGCLAGGCLAGGCLAGGCLGGWRLGIHSLKEENK
jgi:hypothetical protein